MVKSCSKPASERPNLHGFSSGSRGAAGGHGAMGTHRRRLRGGGLPAEPSSSGCGGGAQQQRHCRYRSIYLSLRGRKQTLRNMDMYCRLILEKDWPSEGGGLRRTLSKRN
jgi:hypothetical protein